MSKTQPARGTRDFLPSEVKKRNYVINIIKEVYESYGFEPLETPSVENLETLTGKYGEEGNQLMFKILKRGEKLAEELNEGKIKHENQLSDLALRYDLTVPLARVVANNKNELPKFFKRYQIQPVWRADRPARGRYREFYQCDVDAIGSNSMLVEAEQISAVCEILERLGFKDFVIKINHRGVLDGLMELAMIEKEKRTSVLVVIDKLDKIGLDGIKQELSNLGLSERSINAITNSVAIPTYWSLDEMGTQKFSDDPFEANLQKLKILYSWITILDSENESKEIYSDAIGKLQEIVLLTENHICKKHLRVEQSLARGLSYYTGAIFEIALTNGDFAGSIGGGGRYDGLIGMFGKEQIPACGFSLGLERILVVMEERGMFQKLIDEGKLILDSADVLVTIWNEETAGESLKLANELRKAGLRVLVYPEADKLGKQFKYADSLGIKTAIILREEEINENKVKIKDLTSGDETIAAREEIVSKLKNGV